MAEDPFEHVRQSLRLVEAAPDPDPDDQAPREKPPGRQSAGLDPECPVIPLGVEGDVSFYLDALGQVRGVEPSKHGRAGLVSLYGPRLDFLYRYYPRLNKEGDPAGFRPESAAEDLMEAAARRGVWNPMEWVRGRGAWQGDDGELVYHCGNCLAVHGQTLPTGAHGRYIYPKETPGLRPLALPPGDARIAEAARTLESLLGTWEWQHTAAPRLLLGWICAALFGGALDFRPLLWLSGERGTGKSTLIDLVKAVIVDIIASSDTSAAGLWQQLGNSALPVAIDEAEPDDNRRMEAVVKLARQAASGGLVLRGGADHRASSFIARSAFLFSSILVPPLTPADRSRIVVLDLEPLADTRPPSVTKAAARELGAALRRRIADRWTDWPERLEQWQAALRGAGRTARSADAWGVPMAAADLVLHDTAPSSDELEAWVERLAAIEAAGDEDRSDAAECLAYLTTSTIEGFRGGLRHTIAHHVREAVGQLSAHVDEFDESPNKILATIGIKVLQWAAPGEPIGVYVAIANSHQGLARVFVDTRWQRGGWRQALRRLPGAKAMGNIRIGGASVKATATPIEALGSD